MAAPRIPIGTKIPAAKPSLIGTKVPTVKPIPKVPPRTVPTPKKFVTRAR